MKKVMIRFAMLFSVVAALAVIGGCSKKGRNTAAGTVIGAAAGTGIGALAGGNGPIIGAITGGMFGGIIGNASTNNDPVTE